MINFCLVSVNLFFTEIEGKDVYGKYIASILFIHLFFVPLGGNIFTVFLKANLKF